MSGTGDIVSATVGALILLLHVTEPLLTVLACLLEATLLFSLHCHLDDKNDCLDAGV